MITCVPEIKIEKLSKANDFLIIACDGIWDCLTSQESIDMGREFLRGSQAKGNLSVFLE